MYENNASQTPMACLVCQKCGKIEKWDDKDTNTLLTSIHVRHFNVRQQILQRQKERLTTAAADILKRYDKNGDGKLDQGERDAMLKEFADAQTIARLARDFSLIERIDLNHDLKLSDDELQSFEQRVSNRPPHQGIRKQPRPARPAAGLPQPPAKPADKPADK